MWHVFKEFEANSTAYAFSTIKAIIILYFEGDLIILPQKSEIAFAIRILTEIYLILLSVLCDNQKCDNNSVQNFQYFWPGQSINFY